LLNFSAKTLTSIIYGISEENRYSKFEIPKKNGEKRVIFAPTPKLKMVQKKLLRLLEACESEINDGKFSPAHGFKKEKSIFTNAKIHRNRKIVINLDIKDFFPSINFGRIKGFFISNKNYKISPEVSQIIAHICCHKGHLPQGAPTSPIISNIICHILDINMLHLAKKYRFEYSRYADDITLSTNIETLPKGIVHCHSGDGKNWVVGSEILKIFKKTGFEINHQKTRVQFRNSRQEVTGLSVNKIVNVRIDYRKKARAMFHNLVWNNHYYFKDNTSQLTNSDPLAGALNFIRHIKNEQKRYSTCDEHQNIMPLSNYGNIKGFEKTIFKFYTFTKFVNNPKPLLICEGKTDYIYLGEAIRLMAGNLPPEIASISNGNTERNIAFFNYTNAIKEVYGLEGGIPQLKILIEKYETITNSFPSHYFKNPVIILIDNDAESKSIINLAAGKKKKFNNLNYCYFGKNLYIQLIPKNDQNKEVSIEDLFPDHVLRIEVDGKKFSKSNKPCGDQEYGKQVFATKVVKKKLSLTDFNEFYNLLINTSAIIKEHASKQYEQV
jgi:hypothetical protein